jgi:hypothetical protein
VKELALMADPTEPSEQSASGPGSGPDADQQTVLAADERGLLEAFDRLAPQGTLGWNFDDAVRRLVEPDEAPGRPAGWGGLPADLWQRGRSTKASERVLGDVIKIVAQDLSEYTDRAVEEGQQVSANELGELRRTAFDAIRFLAARVEQLESALDPVGMRPGQLDLPIFDSSEWSDAAVGWTEFRADLPVVIGELGDSALLTALAGSGVPVEGVDPRGTVVWAVDGNYEVGTGRIDIMFAEVVDHLRSLPDASRGCVVLSGCVDRSDLARKMDLVDEACRVVARGGSLVLLTTDQVAWDASLGPIVRDLLPGRPLHPETWLAVLADRGLSDPKWLRPSKGSVHAVVAEVRR